MLEQFIPALQPKNETQANIQYAAMLYGVNQIGEGFVNRFFKTKKEKLEEQILEKQLEALSNNPDSETFNALQYAKPARFLPGILGELRKPIIPKKTVTLSDVLRGGASENVDFRLAMKANREAFARRVARGLSKAI